jgi:opacity protein-like surface antigen
MHKPRTALLLLAVFAVAIVAVSEGRADPLRVQGKLSQTFEYDENPLLSTREHEAAMGSITSPELLLNADFPGLTNQLDLRADVNRYDLKGFDSDDFFGALRSRWVGTVWSASLNASFDYDTTRTSELGTSGINAAGIRHSTVSLGPEIGVALTPQDMVNLGGSYVRSAYGDTRRYTNYEVLGLSPRFAHAFDERNSALATVRLSRFQTRTGPTTTVDTVAPMAGWERKISETLTVSALVGIQQMRSSVGSTASVGQGDSSSTDLVFDSSLTYRDQQDRIVLALNRQPSPSGDGTMNQATGVSLSLTHTLSPPVRLNLDLSYKVTELSGNRGESNERVYLTVSPRLSYRIIEDVDVGVSYRYRQQKDILGEISESQSVLLNFVYTPVAADLGL